jgi:DNA-binding MarR family transcriptional regulator
MDQPELQKLYSAINVFRTTTDRDIPVQHMVIFLYVVLHDGCLQQVLETATGMSGASVSRTLDKLGDVDRHGKPGLKMIRREQDPDYYKRYRLYLTAKGRDISALIRSQLED